MLLKNILRCLLIVIYEWAMEHWNMGVKTSAGVISKNSVQCCDDIAPNQNVKKNPGTGESPTFCLMFSSLENDLDSVCVCVCSLVHCRFWWVRTRTEREWWLTSQHMTNPYPACNSTPVVRHTHAHTLRQIFTHAHLFFKRKGKTWSK